VHRVAQVLVADDDEAVRALVRISLEIDGHEIVGEAADGREALDGTTRLRPDVLVLDMMIPGTNGADVLRELRTFEGDRPCVVAYSASPAHLELADSLGANAVVLKTGDMAPLLAAVAAC
jgi:CheY-like chemotaxis protein